ncbi:MAG: NusG domain II-containing protein [Candidatus Syntrophosphaera sp.]|nr:NusG domain II-containing protein [Candidatus Syntrophosphaera sp.]
MLHFLREKLSLADLLLMIVVLLAIVLSAFMVYRKNDDRYVHVHKDNRPLGVFPLNVDRVIRIDEHNTVQIKDSQVLMLSADCPDRRCVKQGAGSVLPIVCLPNRVVVEIRGQGSERVLIVR